MREEDTAAAIVLSMGLGLGYILFSLAWAFVLFYVASGHTEYLPLAFALVIAEQVAGWVVSIACLRRQKRLTRILGAGLLTGAIVTSVLCGLYFYIADTFLKGF